MNTENEGTGTGTPPPAPTSGPAIEPASQAAATAGEPSSAPAPENTAPAESSQQDETELPVLDEWPMTGDVKQEFEVFIPPKDGKFPAEPVLPIPSTTGARTGQMLDRLPNLDYESMEDGPEWASTLEQSGLTLHAGDGFRDTADREGSQWRQQVISEKGPLVAGVPRFKETEGPNLTGEKAVMRVRALLGMGSIVQIPLWHSGFWVTLKAPTEGALLELNRRISEEKVALGRYTHGLAYANTSVFFAGWLTDFVLSHVYDSSLNPQLLQSKTYRQLIKSLDLPILIWGLACSIWPKGFPYARSVIDMTGSKTKVLKELLNVSKLLWVDNASLTPWQIGHMANRMGNTMTEQGLEKYQSEFSRGQGRRVELAEGIAMMTKVPNLQEYLVVGQEWVNNIVSMVDKAFSMGSPEERNQYIVDQGKATNMRQYMHWVQHLEVGDGVVDHKETLERMFDTLSAKDEVREVFFPAIRKFIEDSTMAIVAIPATEESDKAPLPRFPHLLPIDAMSVFFILLVQKVALIQNR
jgi:hypothetical protein